MGILGIALPYPPLLRPFNPPKAPEHDHDIASLGRTLFSDYYPGRIYYPLRIVDVYRIFLHVWNVLYPGQFPPISELYQNTKWILSDRSDRIGDFTDYVELQVVLEKSARTYSSPQ